MAFLDLLLAMAEGMAANPIHPSRLGNFSTAQPTEDPRPRMLEDLRRMILHF